MNGGSVRIHNVCAVISQLKGAVVRKGGMEVVIDCHGVGYAVSVPLSTLDLVPREGESVTLLTVLAVREDAMQLYGFISDAERDAFKLLTTIQGVGGRTALGILSASTLAGLRQAIATGNVAALTRLPGIGKKTAERIVVELREKIIGVDTDTTAVGGVSQDALSHTADDAISALQALGYSRAAAEKAISAAIKADSSTGASTEALIRAALKQ